MHHKQETTLAETWTVWFQDFLRWILGLADPWQNEVHMPLTLSRYRASCARTSFSVLSGHIVERPNEPEVCDNVRMWVSRVAIPNCLFPPQCQGTDLSIWLRGEVASESTQSSAVAWRSSGSQRAVADPRSRESSPRSESHNHIRDLVLTKDGAFAVIAYSLAWTETTRSSEKSEVRFLITPLALMTNSHHSSSHQRL
jgi:hypothetical protein